MVRLKVKRLKKIALFLSILVASQSIIVFGNTEDDLQNKINENNSNIEQLEDKKEEINEVGFFLAIKVCGLGLRILFIAVLGISNSYKVILAIVNEVGVYTRGKLVSSNTEDMLDTTVGTFDHN